MDSSSTRQMYATETDWELYRDTITKLYSEQDKPLREVMEIMQGDHVFRATTKMFKTRIKKWGLDKKHKAPEVLEMLRLKRQRDTVGKRSKFFTRNRPVNWEDVERYIKRSRTLLAKSDSGFLEIGGHATGVVCRTPSPDPSIVLSVPGNMEASEEFRTADEVARIMRDYCRGAIEGGIWIYNADESCYFGHRGSAAHDRLSKWYGKMLNVVVCIIDSRIEQGFRLINACFNQLQRIVKEQDPRLLFYLVVLRAALFDQSPMRDLGRLLVNHIRDFSRIIFGERHPISLLWVRCYSGHKSDQDRLQLMAARSFLDYFDSLGNPASTTKDVFKVYFHLLKLSNDSHSLLKHSNALRNTIKSEFITFSHARMTFLSMIGLSHHLVDLREYSEAEILLESAWQWLSSQDHQGSQHLFHHYYDAASTVKSKRGQHQEALQLSWMSYRYGVENYGTTHVNTLEALWSVIGDVEQSGEKEEAEELRQYYREQHSASTQRQIEEIEAEERTLANGMTW
ncbi:MAG: hypothetical protein M1813_007864 [Trichoglossum hirsutum]|nr:MAG: hypothetical protein M1813_007864 [Trichoglossum hirsutum]